MTDTEVERGVARRLETLTEEKTVEVSEDDGPSGPQETGGGVEINLAPSAVTSKTELISGRGADEKGVWARLPLWLVCCVAVAGLCFVLDSIALATPFWYKGYNTTLEREFDLFVGPSQACIVMAAVDLPLALSALFLLILSAVFEIRRTALIVSGSISMALFSLLSLATFVTSIVTAEELYKPSWSSYTVLVSSCFGFLNVFLLIRFGIRSARPRTAGTSD